MSVMAGSCRRYGDSARPGRFARKVYAAYRKADTIRYDGYSTSGWRSRNRYPRSQSIRSWGRRMQVSLRSMTKHYRAGVLPAACPPVIGCIRWALAGELPVAPRPRADSRLSLPRSPSAVPVLNPQLAARYWLPTTGYFVCGGSPQARFRLVSEQNASLTFEKEKQSCTDL